MPGTVGFLNLFSSLLLSTNIKIKTNRELPSFVLFCKGVISVSDVMEKTMSMGF